MPDMNAYHEVICDMFFQKLSHSCAHLIEVARNQYGIDLKATDSLIILADNAKAAARRYVLDYMPQNEPTKKTHGGNVAGFESKLSMSASQPGASGGWKKVERKKRKERATSGSGFPELSKLADDELLERFKRCKICGFKPQIDSKTGERLTHACDASAKAKRIEAMRKDLKRNKDPHVFPSVARKMARTDK